MRPVCAFKVVSRTGLKAWIARLFLRGKVPILLQFANGKQSREYAPQNTWFEVRGGLRDVKFWDESWALGFVMYRARGPVTAKMTQRG